MTRPNILITNHLSPHVITYLKSRANIDIQIEPKEANLVKQIKNYDALICRSATRIRSCVLGTGKKHKLKIIGTATSGFDHINIHTAKELGIPVVHSPNGNTVANAEYIIGAMIAISRNFFRADKLMRKNIWNQEAVLGTELYGKTFGTVGFGRIGSLASIRAQAFGMKTLAYDPYLSSEKIKKSAAQRVSLKKLLKDSDFISLSMPLTSETKNLIGSRELSWIRPSAYIIQASRGGTVDEQALIYNLQHKKIAGAVVDVYEEEPSFRQEFVKLENVILTPHYACSTIESRKRSGMFVAKDILNYLAGKKPLNTIPA